MAWRIGLAFILFAALAAAWLAPAAEAPEKAPAAKPKIAFFPLGGDANEDLRQRSGLSLRLKLDRTGTYEVIDGPKMAEIAAEAKDPITFDTAEAAIRELGKLVEADVLVWGDLDRGGKMRLKILDLRAKDPKVREITKTIAQATDLRFVSEEILETLPGVETFTHPPEEAVHTDLEADELFKKNPNLVFNGDFSVAKGWEAIYQAELYQPPISEKLPAVDKVVIYKLNEGGKTNNVLAMNLSKTCAENNGMACLSAPIEAAPDTRYRLVFRYKSDGPVLHVFVKGYTAFENIKGEKVQRPIYQWPVPPTGGTGGKWVEVVSELNPQHVEFRVQTLRVDLYAYLTPGTVMFDDVVLKAVGRQNRKATDEAIDKPISRPKGSK